MGRKLDPVTVEIIRNKFKNIVEEMAVVIHKTAYSTVVQEARDFSCAVFLGTDCVAISGLTDHSAAMPGAARAIMQRNEYEGFSDGDIILLNDPYKGGTHTPDLRTARPTIIDDLTFLVLTSSHLSDVGGAKPGTMSGHTTDIYQEGLRLPGVKLVERGVLNKDILGIITANMRGSEERVGDVRSMMAACNTASDRLKSVLEKYGCSVVESAIRQFLDDTEKITVARIKELKEGVYEYEDYLDSDGVEAEPLRLHMSCQVNDGRISVDFAGTSKQARGNTNCTTPTRESGVYCALKAILDPFSPFNSGFCRRISITAPVGTFVNALPPAATCGFTEVGLRIFDSLLAALADAHPKYMASPSSGSSNHTVIGGTIPGTGKPYIWYEFPAGGSGATGTQDGADALWSVSVGNSIMDYPIERAEMELPFRVELYALRRDSCGPGKYRGGLGLRRDLRFLDRETREVGALWERARIPNFGLSGGYGGWPHRVCIIRNDGSTHIFPVMFGCKAWDEKLEPGEVISLRTGGGGGFGDPLERPPKDVLRDVLSGYISYETAGDVYGVVIKDLTIDEEASQRQRAKIRISRVYCTVRSKSEEFTGRRRIARVSPEMLTKLSMFANGLIEVFGEASAPLRLWIAPDESYSEAEIGLDDIARRILRVKSDDKVWVRDPLESFREEN